METRFRQPTRHDIGREVEVFIDGEWEPTILQEIGTSSVGTFCGLSDYFGQYSVDLVRVPYTTADPIAELSEAADWLADRQKDEAARVLMAEIERRQKPVAYNQLDFSSFLANPPEPLT